MKGWTKNSISYIFEPTDASYTKILQSNLKVLE